MVIFSSIISFSPSSFCLRLFLRLLHLLHLSHFRFLSLYHCFLVLLARHSPLTRRFPLLAFLPCFRMGLLLLVLFFGIVLLRALVLFLLTLLMCFLFLQCFFLFLRVIFLALLLFLL